MASRLLWTFALLAAISCPPINAQDLGQQVSLGEVPSIAQVEVRVGTVWVQQCVGSVLTSVHVLTVASCFSGPLFILGNRRIRAGTPYRGNDGLIVQVNVVNNHPNFGSGSSDSDISVVRLAASLPLGGNIQQGQILAPGIVLPVGLSVRLYGWGTTAQGSSTSNVNLYGLSLLIQAQDRCRASFSDEPVTENMICAGLSSGGRDYDPRDMGAPLVYNNVVVGIVSFGASTGSDSAPVVSAAIGSFTNWIISVAV